MLVLKTRVRQEEKRNFPKDVFNLHRHHCEGVFRNNHLPEIKVAELHHLNAIFGVLGAIISNLEVITILICEFLISVTWNITREEITQESHSQSRIINIYVDNNTHKIAECWGTGGERQARQRNDIVRRRSWRRFRCRFIRTCRLRIRTGGEGGTGPITGSVVTSAAASRQTAVALGRD